MEAIARQPNVHVKLSEFGLRDQPWDWTANAYIVRETLAIFGWERCMFASNFPVAGLRITYAELVHGLQRMLDQLTREQRAAVMAHNAIRFYRLNLPLSMETERENASIF
jgi:predicted TIM-barrel fold metal-dependent hydrolase